MSRVSYACLMAQLADIRDVGELRPIRPASAAKARDNIKRREIREIQVELGFSRTDVIAHNLVINGLRGGKLAVELRRMRRLRSDQVSI